MRLGHWSTEVHQVSRNIMSINTPSVIYSRKSWTVIYSQRKKNHHALTSFYPPTTTGALKCHIAKQSVQQEESHGSGSDLQEKMVGHSERGLVRSSTLGCVNADC